MAEVQMTDDDRSARYGKVARRCGIGLYVAIAIWGAIHLVFFEKGALHLAFVVLITGLATGWAIYDAKSRGIRFLPILQMLYFLVWPVGAVIYLMYRSGLRGLLTAILHGIGLMMTFYVVFFVTFITLHSTGMLDARFYP